MRCVLGCSLRRASSTGACFLLLFVAASARAADQPVLADRETVLRECLVLRPVGGTGRSSLIVDALEATRVAGRWKAPAEGDMVTLPNGSSLKWEKHAAGNDGWISHPGLSGGYAYMTVHSAVRRAMILEASGHALAYVNGEPRVGDPYGYGYVRLPVLLREGVNEFLFQGSRGGRIRASLHHSKGDAQLDNRDATLPDAIVGEPVDTWGAVIVQSTSTESLNGLVLRASLAGAPPADTPLPTLAPLSMRKTAFRIKAPALMKTGTSEVRIELLRQGKSLGESALRIRVRGSQETHKRTFISGIDGSVQYYAVNPARSTPGVARTRPALFLSLHGAGVEAIGQADAYSGKSWGHVVAPTNRRPYGFDWEDWGRLDALEVLDLAQKKLDTDPQRTYLTGHSMGGHGVWHLGATFPDRFAAIGPSAGWISFFSYGGSRRTTDPAPVEELFLRARAPSDTLTLLRNYDHHGVYLLHGGADDNVPAREARQMVEHLGKFHRDFRYHEQPGAGHWWDASDEPGTDCVDWAPMFDFFARHVIPSDEGIRQVDFTTASPGVSARSHWVSIEAQTRLLKPSRANIRFDPGMCRFTGTTENVARLSFRLNHALPLKPLRVELDGTELANVTWPEDKRLWLERIGDAWKLTQGPSPSHKGPRRYGPFKEAFRNRVLFVYGTRGTPEENAWAFAKARFDAETFWYRGNASIDVIPDAVFDAARELDRNVIVYGNADTNAAWKALLADSPVQVQRGHIRVGDRTETGNDLACLFLRPRPSSDQAVVGVVAGSGLAGMRLTDRLPYAASGVGYPDCVLLGPETLSQGAVGIRAAGFFGLDWGVATGEFAWRK